MKINSFWQRIKQHKIITGILFIALVVLGYRWLGGNAAPALTRYVLAQAEKGTLVVSVSGAGQVLASNQIDVKPKVSGDVIYVPVVQGQVVHAGATLAQLDATDAQKTVRDAEMNLESAQLSLDKLKQSSADIGNILDDAFGEISNSFLDFPTIITGAQEIILGSTFNPRNQDNIGYYKDFIGQANDAEFQKVQLFIDSASSDYAAARAGYDEVLVLYKNTNRSSDADSIQALLVKTISVSKAVAQALKSEQNLLDYLTDFGSAHSKTLPALATTYKTNLRTYIGQANSHLASLSSSNNSIANAPLDIRSQELSIKQRQNALADAKAALDDYYVRAPLGGVIAKLSVKKGDAVSAGTVLATMISAQKLAEISLNEVDIAKIKLGQKATLTFDAAQGLTIVGSVAQIDTLGTVTQGVVTYKVDISFDTEDNQIKPGMSVGAAIIIDTRTDVLLVPSGAVKAQGSTSYIEMFDAYTTTVPQGATSQGVTSDIPSRQQTIQVGASNDTMTEITGGLNEGEYVISRTIAASATTAAATSGLRIPGLGGGGAIRATGR